jgi:hypothetical protein
MAERTGASAVNADKITPERYAAMLAQQEAAWPQHVAAAKNGNPFATLCNHCYLRHPPPRDGICQREAVTRSAP